MKILYKVFLMVLAMLVGQAAAANTCTAVLGSKNWNSTSTWTGCNNKVPQDGDTVIIPSGSTVTLDTDSKKIASLTVAAGGVLQGTGKNLDLQGPGNLTNNGTLSLGSGDIKIEGNFANAGTFTAGTGRVEFKGNAAQTITGNVTFYDLKVDNGSSNGLTLAGNVVVANKPSGNAETGGLVKLTSTCPTDYTLTSDSGAVVQHSCSGGGATVPTVTTSAATSITAAGATLNGTVSSNGASTTVTFNYGLTTSYGSTATASASPLAAGAANSAVSAAVTGLACGTTYHFQASGTNSAGTQTGSDLSFSTSACSVPSVTSINRVDFNPARAGYAVSWTVIFNTAVTGVDAADFALIQTGGASGASISGVSGSGSIYTVTASTGAAGTLGLNLVDNDSIVSGSVALGGAGLVNGNFTGQTYTLLATVCTGAADILFCDDFERSNPGSVGNNWTVTPASASSCTGISGNAGCAGIDGDIPPFNTYTNPRPNSTRAMFTRWSIVSVDSPVVSLSGVAGAQLSFWIRRGRDTFSECPEASGENYLVQYYASNSTWKTLAQYPSSPTAAACDGQIFTPTIELPPDALHANFKMRFYQPSGSGSSGTTGGATGVRGYDYWHMDDVMIRKVTAPTYVGAFCDNFEAGLSRWSISAENYVSGNIGDASVGSLAYQSGSHELDMRWGYVTASTFKTNLTGVSGDITFWLKSGTGTKDPVTNENLVVEYLNSSGAWIILNTYLGSVGAGTSYSASFALPTDAKHAGFRLRFRQVSGSGYDKSYWHIDDVCVGTAVATSDLALTKTGDTTLIPGTNTFYTLKATNNGPDALSGAIQVIDTLPSGLTYLSGGGTGWLCTANAQVVTCNWSGSLANGALAPDLIITASVGAGVTGSLTNTAVLTGTGNDPATGNNTASFTSGNFIPYFIFTNSACVDGIAIGQTGQTCSDATWTSLVAGQPKTGIYITAVNASRVPTRLSTSASTTVTTQFGLTCHDPIANAGVQATFTATAAALPLCTGNGADPTSWSTATSLTFASGAPSIATSYTFTYADVGQVELFMRNSVATSQVGKSGSFVVKPAGFVLSGIKCTTYAAGTCATSAIASPGNNPGATTASGLAFIQAGQSFTAIVTALTASGKTKADAGTTVNCTTTSTDCTPNFGQEQTKESVGLLVANAIAGMVTAPDLAGTLDGFASGIASGTAFSWDEVGIITLTPALLDSDYLGAGDVTGTVSGKVGRFIPDHFNTMVIQVAGVPMACPDGLCPATYNGIVYSGQSFSVTVSAKNASDATTANYNTTTGFAKSTLLTPYGALGAATAVSGAGALGVASVTAFAAGTLTEATEKYTFTATPTNPTNIYINASDGEASSRRTSNPTTTSIEGGVRVVSGRISIPNMYGSEQLQLPLTATVQYYSGTNWVTSLTDSVTSFNTNLSTAGGNLVPTVKTGLAGGVTVVSPGTAAVVAGVRTFILAAPLVSGSVELSLNAPTYLPNAASRATFGIFKSPLIYRRENY